GMFTAIAVLATVGVLFTILPVFLHRFPISDDLLRRQSGSHDGAALPRWARRICEFVIGRPQWNFAFWVLVMVAVGLGMLRIGTSVQLLKLLDEDAPLIHDYAWLESHLGNLVPMEVILTVPPERCRTADQEAESDGNQYRMTMLERLEMIREIQRREESLKEVSRVLSVATFTPQSTQSGIGAADTSTDYAKNKSLEEHRNRLLDGDYLRIEHSPVGGVDASGRELWRMSARVAALSEDEAGVDYGQFVDELKACVDPVLRTYDQRDEVIRQLHGQGKKLHGSRLVFLYRADSREANAGPDSDEGPSDATDVDRTPAQMLQALLSRSGVEVKNRGLIRYNLASYDDPQQGSPEADRHYREMAVKSLSQYDAVIVANQGGDPTVQELAKQGAAIIDVSQVPFAHEWSNVTAAQPLEQAGGARPIRAVYTGMVPLVYKTQRQLLVSLRESIAWATALIAVVMMFVLRSFMAGIVSMIPNVFPIFTVFGALGWLVIKVDIGIMMTASVALGVAVDDTIHYLTWFRRGIGEGLNRYDAAMQAYERCATAMLQTTLIGGLGLAVFATSTFTPTQQFGYLMITMLGAALIGDLLLLPAILVGPLGRFFQSGAPVVDRNETAFSSQSPEPRRSSPQPHLKGAPHAEPQAAAVESASGDLDSNARHESQATPAASVARVDAGPASADATPPAIEQTAPAPRAGSLSDVPAPGSDDGPRGGLPGVSGEERQALSEGPHAALHAKLRRLRRESAQDSLPS
ncbi:MAG: MMPL family transporter, partial [Planctomycetales bacterium]|nr:MMPL family transporter [Planctomycetales bacterium]